MKLARTLLRIGALANFAFFLFHLWLGWRIHGLAGISPGIRSLLEMLNGGGSLFVLFLAVASWLVARERAPSALGWLVITLGAAMYLLRASAEVVVAPHFSVLIFGTCLAAGLIYVGAAVGARRATPVAAPMPAMPTG